MILLAKQRRAGMTLVELLVVVAIIGLLAVTVLPNVSATAESRRSREASRIASGFIAKAQSRAIGRPEWAGMTIVPANDTVPYAIDLFQANVPQVYRGESFDSCAFISGFNPLSRDMVFVPPIPDARNVARGDLIRFDGMGPWYELVKDPYRVRLRGTLGGSASADEMVGQTGRNTPWPAQSATVPQDVVHSFEILRQPARNGAAFTIPDGRCIDLSWSGYGPPNDYKYLAGEDVNRNGILEANEDANGNDKLDLLPFAPVTVLFDSTGRMRQIMKGAERLTVTGPVYFLVGRVDRASNNPLGPSTLVDDDDSTGFNWQYGDSYWIVVDPASGIVRTAECRPVKNYSTLAEGLRFSQDFARSETPTGGR